MRKFAEIIICDICENTMTDKQSSILITPDNKKYDICQQCVRELLIKREVLKQNGKPERNRF